MGHGDDFDFHLNNTQPPAIASTETPGPTAYPKLESQKKPESHNGIRAEMKSRISKTNYHTLRRAP